jgi:hypothetical protein
MYRSKKSKLNLSSSSEDFAIYLEDPSLIDQFHKLSTIELVPGRFVKFSDLADYNLGNIFMETGLLELYDVENKTPHYPTLILLFFTNLTRASTLNNKDILKTLVKGIEIKLSPKSIGKILNIPFEGVDLDEVD